MAEEGVAIPGEEEGGSALNPEIQEQRVKESARTKGWKPLKEWEGDPAEWVPAKEFLGREKLFKKIHDLQHSLGQQSKRHASDLKVMQDHFAKVRDTEYKRAVEDLKAARKEAIASGDVKEADRIDENLDAIREEKAKADQQAKVTAQAETQAGPSEAFLQWHNENSWFNRDNPDEITKDAIEIGTGHAQANPSKSQADVLKYVTEKIKRLHPEKFGTSGRRGSQVESGGSVRMETGSNKKGKMTTADLNEMEQSVLSTLLKTKALKYLADKNKRTETEQYLADLAEVKGLR